MEGEFAELICDYLPHRVVVTDTGPQRIEVVKVLRSRLGLGLWDARCLIGHLPVIILDDVPEYVAAALVAALRDAGAEAHAEPAP